jgi:RNA-dependent RNA polymerase
MPIDTWEWLHTLHFGSIIFANPKPGTVSLPAQIAAGDLDGDLYFICWAAEILQHIETEPIDIDLPVEEDIKPEYPHDPEWFSQTQELMIDAPAIRALQALIGKFYTTAKKVADKSEMGMHDEDSIMYARAYKKALEIGKHGGQVYLPAHLHGKIPERFHKFLVSDDTL